MAKILIPTPLRKFTANASQFETKANTVQGALADLTNSYQALRKHLLDDNDQLRSFIRLYVGDEDVDQLDREATAIGPDTVLSIIPAIAGGSGHRNPIFHLS